MKKTTRALGVTLAIAMATHAAADSSTPAAVKEPVLSVTEEDVGELDSFGRNVIYLGLAETPFVYLNADCSIVNLGPRDRCLPLVNSSARFNQADLKTLRLPAGASQSLLCYSIAPFLDIAYQNATTAERMLLLIANAKVVITNDVLNDPTLIDPATRLPYGGRMTRTIPLALEWGPHAPNNMNQGSTSTAAYGCGTGLVSKRLLRSAGLSETQVNAFFTSPMTLSLGISGTVQSAESASFNYTLRLYGDR